MSSSLVIVLNLKVLTVKLIVLLFLLCKIINGCTCAINGKQPIRGAKVRSNLLYSLFKYLDRFQLNVPETVKVNPIYHYFP